VQELFGVLLSQERTRVVRLDVEVRAELDKLAMRRATRDAIRTRPQFVRPSAAALNAPFCHNRIAELVSLPRILAAVRKVHRDERVIRAVLNQVLGGALIAPRGRRAVSEARN